jgi:hypothetical protein
MDPFKGEPQLKMDVQAALENDFYIEPNARGIWPLDGSVCELDFLLKPKPQTVALGFDAECFAIEVKSPVNGSNESVKKLLDCVLQSYTYSLGVFGELRPKFVLIYPSVPNFFQYDFINKYKGDERNKYKPEEIRILRRLMQRANVGELTINAATYQIDFAASRYFDPIRGRSNIKERGQVRF